MHSYKKSICMLIILIFSPLIVGPALAHTAGADLSNSLLAADRLSLALLTILGILYLRGMSSLHRKSSISRNGSRRHLLFFSGWLVLSAALLPPVDSLSSELFSAHMVQHELMILLAAPLLVFSRPAALLISGMPNFSRKKFIWILRRKSTMMLRRFMMLPTVAWLIHALALWAWHVPELFQASLRSDLVHTLQHGSFFASALLFWWACSVNRYREIGVAVFLFTTAAHTSLLGALLTFSNKVWYPYYFETAPSWGLSALQDQQLGGLIMWVPGGLAFLMMSLYSLMALLASAEDDNRHFSEKIR